MADDILIELSADDIAKAADERDKREAEITRLRAEVCLFEMVVCETAKALGVVPDNDAIIEAIERLRAENETLRRDVKTAIMGDSAELTDVKRENEKLRAAFRVNMLRAFPHTSHDEIDAEIEAAIRESGDE